MITDATEPASSPRHLRNIIEWVLVVAGALLVALLIRSFLFTAFSIPSASMEPTLRTGDRVVVNQLSYRLHDVNRGDVIVFSRPEGLRHSEIDDLIKRVIALGGEQVEARGGHIYVDGRRLVEPYLLEPGSTEAFGPVQVPEGHVFVMGDNRRNSEDSRALGPISEELILGRAFVRAWPTSRLGLL